MDKKSSDKKLVSFRLPEDLLEALRERADQDNTTVTELVCRLMRQGLQTSPDDRISALEDEVRELRQLRQVNFSNLSPMPVYASLMPQNMMQAEADQDTRLRIGRLETQMQAGMAKLEALMEEVLANREMNHRPRMQTVDDPPTDHRP
jgi:hypothetical protein